MKKLQSILLVLVLSVPAAIYPSQSNQQANIANQSSCTYQLQLPSLKDITDCLHSREGRGILTALVLFGPPYAAWKFLRCKPPVVQHGNLENKTAEEAIKELETQGAIVGRFKIIRFARNLILKTLFSKALPVLAKIWPWLANTNLTRYIDYLGYLLVVADTYFASRQSSAELDKEKQRLLTTLGNSSDEAITKALKYGFLKNWWHIGY